MAHFATRQGPGRSDGQPVVDGAPTYPGPQQRKNVGDALAIAAYHAQTDWPIIHLLMADDAPQFRGVTQELALCWVHEGRHYKKLMPFVPQHRVLLDTFLGTFWDYYHDLLAYREQP